MPTVPIQISKRVEANGAGTEFEQTVVVVLVDVVVVVVDELDVIVVVDGLDVIVVVDELDVIVDTVDIVEPIEDSVVSITIVV
ncbi:hypothetical protein WR25_03517 [Diploscapter pachys]|uniref:Uncharacterized protein n=1 Tax=Diploscapter pachys TaxID=2018661 RepID=A0A2A2JD01_9BILA|nr:hypothetical protein WR25_03517 [Diploscapter pachys]